MTAVIILGLTFMFLCGAPLFAVILGFAIMGASLTTRTDLWQDFSSELVDVVRYGTGEQAQILSTIPLFIFAGIIMAEAKTADRLVRAAQAGVGWLPGGLAVVTIFACAAFTTFTGASGVTIVALGGLVMPALIKEKYPKDFSLGLIAGTGSCGLLFPPALPLFVYGFVYGFASEGVRKMDPNAVPFETDRFLFAGIVPGLVLIGILCTYAVAMSVRMKVPRHAFNAKELGRASLVAIPELLLPVIIIAGLMTGITIPEIASLSVFYVLFIEMVVFRDVGFTALWRLVREAMILVGALFIIIYSAAALTNYFVNAEIPKHLVEWITSTIDSKYTFLLSINLLLLVVGMMMDIFSAILVVVPLIVLPAHAFGIDPYHLGVIFLLNLELGYITPPVGLNLFLTSLKFNKPILDVTKATLPFLGLRIIALGLVTYIPALTIVPEAKRTGDIDTMVRMVRDGNETINSVQQITLPDGEVVTLKSCKTLTGSEANRCGNLFYDITQCRKKTAGVAECEKKLIDEYAEALAADIGFDLSIDDDDDDDDSLRDTPPADAGDEAGDIPDDDDEELPDDDEMDDDLKALDDDDEELPDDDEDLDTDKSGAAGAATP